MNARLMEYCSTEEFAQLLKVKAQSIRHSLCKKGHYLGIRPRKAPNGRLFWPAEEVERIFNDDERASE